MPNRSEVNQVRKWFTSHVADNGQKYTLDYHQAAIIADTHQNCLVTARAGSGKTRTVVAKIIYLIAYERVKPAEIIVFAFNRKARAEINARLTKITIDGEPLFTDTPDIATTFHAFAFHLLDDGNLKKRLISEDFSNRLTIAALKKILYQTRERLDEKQFNQLATAATQFIVRAEQLYFADYNKLYEEINVSDNLRLQLYYRVLLAHHNYLTKHNLLNFNQMLVQAGQKLQAQTENLPYKYIFIDEYQDFSLLFLTLVQALRVKCPDSHLLAVGDDWQAINGFAGSDVRYFQHFEDYFPEDHVKLFIPTNYRSGRLIVRNANYFMANGLDDYQGCKAGNKVSSCIHLVNLKTLRLPPKVHAPKKSYFIEQTFSVIQAIAKRHPGRSIKILTRNNELNSIDWSINFFYDRLAERLGSDISRFSFSTIHRSKGLEADVVILLEIDAGQFPKPPKPDEIFSIFNETYESRLADEERLFYVALTRAKEELYILTSTPPETYNQLDPTKPNFLCLLNPDWLDEFKF